MAYRENALFPAARVVLKWMPLVLLAGLALAAWALSACAAAPIKLECGEQRFRLENENLSEDQRRFAEESLKDCEERLKTAQEKDSLTIENLNQRFTPGDSL